MNEIPGASVLGFGFNILGTYSTSSITQEIFAHHNMEANTYTYEPTGIKYAVPDNTSVIDFTHTTGSAQVFSSRQQVQKYFSTKAGVSGSYGGFSGAFDAAYSESFETDQSYTYGLYDADFTGWKLALSDESRSWLSDGFVNDPDVEALPNTYTDANKELFFAVFRKFGTHFVSQATLGGSMLYSIAIDSSYSASQQKLEVNVQLEYKAVFVSAKADSETEWSELGKTWAESRLAKVAATGGDASVLNALNPGYDSSDSGVFDSWSKAVMNNPAVVEFQLSPLSLLFSGGKADAVHQALSAYTNGAILALGNSDYTPGSGPGGGNFTTSSSIIVSGNIVKPSPPVTPPVPPKSKYIPPVGGFQVALIDPDTLKLLMSHIYYQGFDFDKEGDVYTNIYNDVEQVGASEYIAVVCGFGVNLMNYPSEDFVTWLTSCGAALVEWKKWIGFTGSPGQLSYTMIGKRGMMPGEAVEDFTAASDWADQPWLSTTDASSVMMLYTHSSLAKSA